MFVGVDEAVSAGGGMRPPSVKAPSMTNVMSDIGAGSSPAAEQQQVRTARGKYISDLNVHSRDGLSIFTIASLKREKLVIFVVHTGIYIILGSIQTKSLTNI